MANQDLNSTLPILISYRGSDGTMQIDQLPVLRDPLRQWSGTTTPGLESVATFGMNGAQYLLLYDMNSSAVEIARLGSLQQAPVRTWNGTWSTRWTSLVPFDGGEGASSTQYLLRYHGTSGAVDICKI